MSLMLIMILLSLLRVYITMVRNYSFSPSKSIIQSLSNIKQKVACLNNCSVYACNVGILIDGDVKLTYMNSTFINCKSAIQICTKVV